MDVALMGDQVPARAMTGAWTSSGRTSPTAFRMKTPEQGAATSVSLAASPQVQGIGGRCFEDCHEAEVVPALRGLSGVLPHALDPDAARRLWDVSEQLLSQARVGATG